MSKKIRIKASKDAPDQVAHGNLFAEKEGGYYETDNRRFADHIIDSGYGTETEVSKATRKKTAKKTAAKTAAATSRASKRAAAATAEVNKAGAEAPPALPAETTEGGTE
jgi:hypothetical protein